MVDLNDKVAFIAGPSQGSLKVSKRSELKALPSRKVSIEYCIRREKREQELVFENVWPLVLSWALLCKIGRPSCLERL